MKIGEIRISSDLTEDERVFISVCDVTEIATIDINKQQAVEVINDLAKVFNIELVGLMNV